MKIRRLTDNDRDELVRMREGLWPAGPQEHEQEHEVDAFLSAKPEEPVVFVAQRSAGGLAGFVEVSIRSYAEGANSQRVAYVEGWWVDPDVRRTGVGRKLISQAEDWARSRGLTELASDSELTNAAGRTAHLAAGFVESNQIVCYIKRVERNPD